jgi:hypothetical protein
MNGAELLFDLTLKLFWNFNGNCCPEWSCFKFIAPLNLLTDYSSQRPSACEELKAHTIQQRPALKS